MQPIGPYRLTGELGRGGMGVVYKAEDTRNASTVAIKVMLAHREASPQARKRHEVELSALARLAGHPHVVPVLDAGLHQGSHFLVLDFVEGQSLEERLRAGPLALDEALRLWEELAGAIAHVHAHGVLHRDLKPANVLLRGSDGAALLTDFGLALELEATYTRVTRTGVYMGSPGYWAPEQATGATRAVSPATDIYGLGAVAYAALCGRPPVDGHTLQQLLDAARNPQVVPPHRLRPELPEWLSAACMRCLEPAPEDRYQSAVELLDALQAPPPPQRRSLRLATLGCLALAVGAGLWALSLLRGRGGEPEAPTPTRRTMHRVDRPWTPAPSSAELLQQSLAAEAGGSRQEAERLARLAAEGGSAPGMLRLSRLVERDPAESFRWALKAAEAGHHDAMLRVARLYLAGVGVAEDPRAAREWLERAAKGGQVQAMFELGELHQLGRGVPRDIEAAMPWFRQAAQADHARALFKVGYAHLRGRGAPRDTQAALPLIERAADAGDVEALFNLGVMHEQGVGLPRSLVRAASVYRRAAEGGSEHAMYNLGVLVYGGHHGSPPDHPQALDLYRRAAKKGKREAMFNLGFMLEVGQGAAIDLPAALGWYRKAAAGKNAQIRAQAEAAIRRLGG